MPCDLNNQEDKGLKSTCRPECTYSTYRVVTVVLKHLETPIVHDNLKTLTKYSERSVQNLCSWLKLSALSDIVQFDVIKHKS